MLELLSAYNPLVVLVIQSIVDSKAGQKLGKNKSLPHFRSENLAIKLSSNIPIGLLTTDLDVYFSIFKQCIKQLSRTSFAYDGQSFDKILGDNKYKFQAGLTPPIMSDLFVSRETNMILEMFKN